MKTNEKLKNKLVLKAWKNGNWITIEHAKNTKKNLAKLEKRYNETQFENVPMKIELYT